MTPNPWRQPCPVCHRPLCAWHSPGSLCDGDVITPPPPPPRPDPDPLPRSWPIRAILVASAILTLLGFVALWSLL